MSDKYNKEGEPPMSLSINKNNVPLGKIIKIFGINVIVDLLIGNNITHPKNMSGSPKLLASINNFVYTKLLDGRIAIGRVIGLHDKSLEYDFEIDSDFLDEEIKKEKNEKDKYLAKVKLIGIYDQSLEQFEPTLNMFPTIGNEVYQLPERVGRVLFQPTCEHLIEIGESFMNDNIPVYANLDVLFGKHLGVFGTTGSGKTCTVVSLIQELKDKNRTKLKNIDEIRPKIIIFDPNNEYEKAFEGIYKYSIIEKEDLRLPHTFLDVAEYYQFLNASSGVQMPKLKTAIEKLRKGTSNFKLEDLRKNLENETDNKIKDWLAPLIRRLEAITSDEILMEIIDNDDKPENTVEEILSNKNEDEISIIHSDFEREEMDIIIFLFNKILYRKIQENEFKNVLLIYEEAHRYLNEEEESNFKLGTYYVQRISREGRKFGISLIISTQKPSQISKTILSQCNSYIIHKLTDYRDLEIAKNIVGANARELVEFVPILEKQHALVVGEAFTMPEIVKINPADPLPKSNDPKVIESWRKT